MLKGRPEPPIAGWKVNLYKFYRHIIRIFTNKGLQYYIHSMSDRTKLLIAGIGRTQTYAHLNHTKIYSMSDRTKLLIAGIGRTQTYAHLNHTAY